MSRPTSARIEPLESRRLLSGATLHGGELRVFGGHAASNAVVVADRADHASIDVTITSMNRRGVHKDFSASFPKTLGVISILVTGGRGNDAIVVDEANALNLTTRVFARAGNDTIHTARGADAVFAGAGDDTVDAGGGNNLVRGEAGNDRLSTGAGNDMINGGLGDDVIDAGAGDDLLRGDRDNDTIMAGAGNDTAHGGRGNDTIFGGDGDDALWGGRDDDTTDAGPGDDRLGGILGTNVLHAGAGRDTFVLVSLDQNPDNDYDSAADVLQLVSPKTPGVEATDGPKI